LLLLVLFAKHL